MLRLTGERGDFGAVERRCGGLEGQIPVADVKLFCAGDFSKPRFFTIPPNYLLFMLVWQMRVDKLVLSEGRRDPTAVAMLGKSGAGVDELRDQLRKAKPAKTNQRLYADCAHRARRYR